MIDRETAVRIVEDELERERRAWAERGVDTVPVAVAGVREHELVWLVSVQSEEYLRTSDWRHMLGGGGPYLVDRVDGGLHRIGSLSSATGAWDADYRSRIRGLAQRTAVDDLHDEVRTAVTARGRIHAMRVLRERLPTLTLADALAYVSGLQQGDVPARLVAVATEALVRPVDPVLTAETIRPGRRPAAGDDVSSH